jgi:nucleotide sugar dehydrogenase
MAEILVVGSGVVGCATGLGLIDFDHQITFVDIDDKVVTGIQAEGYAAVTPEQLELTGSEVIFVSVTALTGPAGIDLSHLLEATRMIGAKIKQAGPGFPVVVFRCTMPPGTTRETLIPQLEEASGRRVSREFGVVYCPEYLRAATAREDFRRPRIVTLASFARHDRAHDRVANLMSDFGAALHWLPFEAAEFQKYVNNVGNAVKISTYNWFRLVAEKVGLDNDQIERTFELSVLSAEGLWNSSYGTRNLGPYSGSCLPKDTAALKAYARDMGVDTALLDAVEDVNQAIGGS